MRWFGKAVVLMLLALWVPVTMHCELEAMPSFSFLQCCCGPEQSPETPSDCDENAGCSAVESGFCKVEDEQTAAPEIAFVLAFLAMDWTVLPLPANHGPAPEARSAPPELAQFWQFSYRTALPPRAPSLYA